MRVYWRARICLLSKDTCENSSVFVYGAVVKNDSFILNIIKLIVYGKNREKFPKKIAFFGPFSCGYFKEYVCKDICRVLVKKLLQSRVLIHLYSSTVDMNVGRVGRIIYKY